ncbi:MAG TPA: hypothetical protein VI959_00480 [Alphaproteobacteria bacterium]|nr:hypothetical protein [Alphaproteobacteria bacterium]
MKSTIFLKTFLVLFTLFIKIGDVFAACTTLNGMQILKGSPSYNCLEMDGSLTFDKLTVATFFKVDGTAMGKELVCQSFEANGALDLQKMRSNTDNKPVENGVVYGALSAKDVFVSSLKVEGACSLENSKIETLEVAGAFLADQVDVSKEAKISGALDATKSKFSSLEIQSTDVVLRDCDVTSDIFIKKDPKDKEQVLKLKGHTKVLGKITFESGKGTLDVDSTVELKNEVAGALKGQKTSKN